MPQRGPRPGPTRLHQERTLDIEEVVDALLLFDEPILNARYHGLLLRTEESGTRERLARLPSQVLQSARLGRRGAMEWARTGGPLDGRFADTAERFLLQSFLLLAEEQMRLIAFMARSAPTLKARAAFDEMAEMHRAMASVLREVMGGHPTPHPRLARLRGAQEEDAAGDLRGQLEEAIRSFQGAQTPPRAVVVSATALRHLRDQGLFRAGASEVLGVPARVDFGWDAPAFAILTLDQVPVEEILGQKEGPSQDRRDPADSPDGHGEGPA